MRRGGGDGVDGNGGKGGRGWQAKRRTKLQTHRQTSETGKGI